MALIYEKKGNTAYITINRPEVMNAMDPETYSELSQAWIDVRDDPDVWCAIITGAGDRAFSAGADLKKTIPVEAEKWHFWQTQEEQILNRGLEVWKPIIAAVNGYALGGGFEIALACDIIIAADHAEVGLPEPRVGLFAGAGGVHRLPRHIPMKIAMGMMLTARRIKVQEAQKLGLINEVVPLADLMITAERWAAEILECAPMSVRATKQMAIQGLDSPLNIAFARNYSEQQKQVASNDRIEGPRAFSEKRPPKWTGT